MDGAAGFDDDPGWKIRWSMLPVGVMPHVYFLRSDQRGEDGLVTLRSVFLSFCLALGLIGIVRVILGDLAGSGNATLSVAVVAAVGVAGLVIQRLVPSRLDGSSDHSLATTFRNRFFLRLAVSEAGALIAFVVSLVVGPSWVYFVGLAFTAVGFARVAPTRGLMVREQDRLTLDGCERSLMRAVRTA